MKEGKEKIFCWHCRKQLSSLTNPKFDHQLCSECKEENLIIVKCLKCKKELLVHKNRDNRTCPKCNSSNKHFSPSAQGIGWR
ncbi:MAG: hypothetical protein WC460_01290 [Patescibacteria group bacterium]